MKGKLCFGESHALGTEQLCRRREELMGLGVLAAGCC